MQIDHASLMTRNNYLRLYLLMKNNNSKLRMCFINTSGSIKQKTVKTYHSILSKYYDFHTAYYSMSQEDRELIEHIINMHF